MATRFRPSVVDRTATGGRVCALVGPLSLRDPDTVNRSFAAIASQGPVNRIGLHPTASRTWDFDASSPTAWSVRRDADTFDPRRADAELARMMGESPVEPISVSLRGDYALINYDHGIGDGQFMFTVPTLLAGDDADAITQWPQSTIRRPIGSALRHALRSDRRQLMAGFTGLVREQTDPTAQSSPAKEDPLTVGPTFVSATSAGGYADAIRRERAASVASTIVAATSRTLRRYGIDPLPTAGVVVDLRRYLPKNAYTLANFMSWVNVPTDGSLNPSELNDLLQSALKSYRPLVGFSIGSALGYLRPHIPEWTAWDVATTNQARLAFSDFRIVPATKRYAWAQGSPYCAIALPLGYRDQISVSITGLPNRAVQLGATFYEGAFDADAIRSTLADVLGDPEAAAAPQ